MATSIAKLAILLTTDTSGMRRGFAAGEASLVSFSGVAARFGSILAGIGAAGGLTWAVKLAADAEKASVAFEVMLQSASEAQAMLGDIRQFALDTPFSQSDLRQSAQMLLQFGVAGEQIMPTLRMLGDVSMGDAERLRLLSLAFGQMSAAGKLMGQDLLQMINAGFNPLQEISARTGIGMADLRKQMEAGNITTAMVTEAFRSATSEGGRFFGMMDAQSQTISGRWAKLREQAEDLARGFGEFLAPAVSKLLDAGTSLLAWMKNIDTTALRIVVSVGAGVVAFTGAVAMIGVVIGTFQKLIAAYRALTTAQAISTAFSGPAGWAKLAIGAGVAAAAVYGVSAMFDQVNAAQQATAKETAAVEGAVRGETTAFAALTEAVGGSQKKMDDLRRSGETLTQSLRTPQETFGDAIAQANELVSAGAITWETYSRAVMKADETLRKATETKRRFEATASVGAAERGTMAGFSAVQQGRAELVKLAEMQKQQLAESKRQTDIQKRIEAAILKQKPIEIGKVSI